MKRIHRYILTIFISVAVLSSIGVYWQSGIISQHHRNYILREGMWTMMEQERTLLNLREIVRRISLGDSISQKIYIDYRIGVFFRSSAVHLLIENNPNFSAEEYTFISEIEQNLQVYATIDNNTLPDQATALRLLPLLDSSVSLSHTLLNIRRERSYDANRETFAYIDQLWHFLLATVIALFAAVIVITITTQQITRREKEQAVARYRYHLTQELHDALNYHLAIVMHKPNHYTVAF